MASESHDFNRSGPSHLINIVDWTNEDYKRSAVASLVQGVYILERDRQQNRQGSQALASPWWESFNFQMLEQLIDDVDSSIFGAIYKFIPPASHSNLSTDGRPCYVIAFRGNIKEPDSIIRDLELDLRLIFTNTLHSRFEIAMQAVRNMVAFVGSSNVWLAGHSLGSTIALLAGKTMAKTGIFLESFLFNSPFLSAPIERIKDEKVKLGIRIVSSTATSLLALAMKKNNHNSRSGDSFRDLSAWVPCLFVNKADLICSEYVGYFEHRKKMEEIGVGGIERLATQHSLGGLFKSAMGLESEPIHLIPSANLMVNSTHSPDFKQAHGIHQWWRPHLHLETTLYKYI